MPTILRCSLSAFVLLTVCGCSGSSSFLGIFPSGPPPLSKTAKALRQDMADLPRELRKSVLDAYILEPGDGLLLLPADLESPVRISADQTILPDGTIDLGKYGRVLVAGKSLVEVEELIQTIVKKETKDAGFIDVRLVNRQSKVFYVLGEVNTPGSFTLSGRETVLDALLTAGGLSERATTRDIILVRPCVDGTGKVLAVHYSQIVQLGDTSSNYQIQPGDRIYVPGKGFSESLSRLFGKED